MTSARYSRVADRCAHSVFGEGAYAAVHSHPLNIGGNDGVLPMTERTPRAWSAYLAWLPDGIR